MIDDVLQSRDEEAALLVIDVQAGLFAKSKGIFKADQLLDTLNGLIDKARETGAAVFFIQHENEKILKRDSEQWQFHPRIRPSETETIIHKQHGNAFEETPLKELLGRSGVTKLIICGLVTHGCVRATCLGALDLGYHTILVSDGHSSYSKDAPKLIEKWNRTLAEKGAEVICAEDVVF